MSLDDLINKITNGDSMELMKELPDNSVVMVITDIPYGEVNRQSNGLRNLDKKDADTLTFELEPFVQELVRICSGSIYIFCGTEQVSEIRKQFVKLKLSTRLGIWEKSNPSPMNGQSLWLSSVECCVYGKKAKATFNEHCKGSVWRFATERSKIHPTQKPVKLFEYLIKTSSNPGNLILDPCSGSGTAAVAARKLGRNYICMDLNPEYCTAAHERVNAVIHEDPRKIGLKDGLRQLSKEQLQKVLDYPDEMVLDEFNYLDGKFCPLAVALDLNKTMIDPTHEKVYTELVKLNYKVYNTRGIKGTFYTTNRKEDLIAAAKEVLKEK